MELGTASLSHILWFQGHRLSYALPEPCCQDFPSRRPGSSRKRRCPIRKALEMKAVSWRKEHGCVHTHAEWFSPELRERSQQI